MIMKERYIALMDRALDAYTREHIEDEVGYRMEEIYGIPLTDVVKKELVRFVQNNSYLLYADQECFDDVVGEKHKEIMREQMGNYEGVIGHLCEILNKSEGWGSDRTVNEFEVIFESEHYFGVYFYNGANEYYLVDKDRGAYDLVLGDSPDFVGRFYLDKMGIEKDIRIVNEKAFGSLVEGIRENIADYRDFWTDERIKGLLVLEKALAVLRKGKWKEKESLSLDEKIISARSAGPVEDKEKTAATINLWGRLGVDIKMTPEEFEVLKNGGREAENLLVSLIRSDRCQINGDTYFPEAPNCDYIAEDLEFDLYPQMIHKDAIEIEQR